MPSLYEMKDTLFDEGAAKRYLLDSGIIELTNQCPKCGEQMKVDIERWRYRCRRRSCNVERSMNNNTFFSDTRLKSNEVLMLARLWLAKVSVCSAIDLTGHSEKTVVAFWNHFRQLVSSSIEEDDTVIGGEGIIVEVYETKLGKRKYHRGHRVE